MKKITFFLVLMLALSALLQAQYFGSYGRGDVMLESLNNSLTNIMNNNNTVPASYSLQQNYPNPFNPSTSIQYDIPANSFVKLVVYDITGKEVTMLINETMPAGRYEAVWNGKEFASGVYFARLEAGAYNNIIKMLMLK